MSPYRTVLLCFASSAVLLMIGHAYGQFSTVLNIPPDPNLGDSSTLGSNAQLNLFDGGAVGASFTSGAADGTSTNTEVNIFGGSIGNFPLAFNSTVNISGGDVGINFGLIDSMLNMTGGWIRNFSAERSSVEISGGLVGHFDSHDGSTVNITGGSVGGNDVAFAGSTVNISGGHVGTLTATSGGVVNVSNDAVVDGLFGEDQSVTSISGGNVGSASINEFGQVLISLTKMTIGAELNISGGALGGQLTAQSGSQVTISGGGFLLAGAPIAGLNSVGDTAPVNLPAGATLTGTLSDGTPFELSALDGDSIANGTLTLKSAAPPAIVPGTTPVNGAATLLGARAGQTIVVEAGGSLTKNFNAGRDSAIQVNGGQVGNNLEAVAAQVTIAAGSIGDFFDAFDGSTVSISGGSIGRNFHAFTDSVVNISGGTLGYSSSAFAGSVINITGGSIARGFTADNESTINLSGGAIGIDFRAKEGSEVNISGGSIGGNFVAERGSIVNMTGGAVGAGFVAGGGSVINISGGAFAGGFVAGAGSNINFSGTQFVLGGVDITNSLQRSQPLTITTRDVILSGLLADGSPFSFTLFTAPRSPSFFSPTATLTITLVPEPHSQLLAAVVFSIAPFVIKKKRKSSSGTEWHWE